MTLGPEDDGGVSADCLYCCLAGVSTDPAFIPDVDTLLFRQVGISHCARAKVSVRVRYTNLPLGSALSHSGRGEGDQSRRIIFLQHSCLRARYWVRQTDLTATRAMIAFCRKCELARPRHIH